MGIRLAEPVLKRPKEKIGFEDLPMVQPQGGIEFPKRVSLRIGNNSAGDVLFPANPEKIRYAIRQPDCSLELGVGENKIPE